MTKSCSESSTGGWRKGPENVGDKLRSKKYHKETQKCGSNSWKDEAGFAELTNKSTAGSW